MHEKELLSRGPSFVVCTVHWKKSLLQPSWLKDLEAHTAVGDHSDDGEVSNQGGMPGTQKSLRSMGYDISIYQHLSVQSCSIMMAKKAIPSPIMYLTIYHPCTKLVGGFNPSENISQLGLFFPIYGN